MQKKYPIGIQDFKGLIEEGFLYIDKTDIVYRLVHSGRNAFLGRPRRFGKSLLCSTLRYYFQGEKKLFEGLKIYDMEKEWIKHPVLHFGLSTGEYTSIESLRSTLSSTLSVYEEIYGRNENEETLSSRFAGIIRRAHEQTGQKAVILIDEYDKPLIETLDDKTRNEETGKILKSFYGTMKFSDEHIRFIFLTGVTKFAKVSVFSDLNNIEDISMMDEYAAICGITQEELVSVFDGPLGELAESYKVSQAEMTDRLKRKYDGYHFSPSMQDIYNPFSLLSAFKAKRIGDYWFATGTPTFLTRLIKETDYCVRNLSGVEATASSLGDISTPEQNPVPILYQSGYLSLKDYNEEFDSFILDFPNSEVRNGFLNYLLPEYSPVAKNDNIFGVAQFVRDVRNDKIGDFLNRIKSLIATIPYTQASADKRDNLLEQQYQNVMYIIFTLMGYYVDVEQHFAEGRIDLVVKTTTHIYIMEFKVGLGTADEALAQINKKHYADPYLAEDKQIVKIGIGWSKATRNIDDWKSE